MSARSRGLLPDCSHWSENEVDTGAFKDGRLGLRFGELLRCLSDRIGGTIPLAFPGLGEHEGSISVLRQSAG